ncbi:MAG: M3 family metallopeptidase [Myxococcota bacterium]
MMLRRSLGFVWVAVAMVVSLGACDADSAQGPPPPEPPPLWEAPPIPTTPEEVEAHCDTHLAHAEALADYIAAEDTPRTLEHTLRPFDQLLVEVHRAQGIAELYAYLHPDAAMRQAGEACLSRARGTRLGVYLDEAVAASVEAVDREGLGAEGERVRQRLVRYFREAGADLDEDARSRLLVLQIRASTLEQEFLRNVAEASASMEVGAEQLAGLAQSYIDARRLEGEDDVVVLTVPGSDYTAVMFYAEDAEVRRAMHELYGNLAWPDNDAVLEELLAVRHEAATILGHEDWASYQAAIQMAGSSEAIAGFIDDVAELARPRAEADLEALLARKQQDHPEATEVYPWDVGYYARRLRAEEVGYDVSEVYPYLVADRVEAGALELVEDLFTVSFEPVAEAPTWHDSVRVYEVVRGGEALGRVYLDLYRRPGKFVGAAAFWTQLGVGGLQLPAIVLGANFSPSPGEDGEPATMSHYEVRTLLHELGHVMHMLLSGRQEWLVHSVVHQELDFVEVPSQLLEKWAWDPDVLARFARHRETGEPIPAELVERMRAAEGMTRGLFVMDGLSYTALSHELHAAVTREQTPMGVYQDVLARYSPYASSGDTAAYASFIHLAGYNSKYYTYLWSAALVEDLFGRFREAGLMDPEVAGAYAQAILEPGASTPPEEMVRDFLGRPSSLDAFEAWLIE